MNMLEKAGEAEGLEPGQEPEFDADKDPGFMRAKEMLLSTLYEKGAAKEISRAIKAAPDPVQGVVDQTLNLLNMMEQVTQGAVPDELVMSFVIDTTQEVVDIAQGSGVKVGNAEVANIVREVLAGVVDALGGDSAAIRQEMGQLDPEEVGAAAMGEGDGAEPIR